MNPGLPYGNGSKVCVIDGSRKASASNVDNTSYDRPGAEHADADRGPAGRGRRGVAVAPPLRRLRADERGFTLIELVVPCPSA